jgi:hypothetical protein
MILTNLESNIVNLLDSDKTVAICHAEGERLKSIVLLVRGAGYGVVVVEGASGDHFVFAFADASHEGNLIGDVRRWSREHGYQFFLKRSKERMSALKEDILMLPDGGVVEISRTYTIASGLTNWGLSGRETMPAGFVQL